MLPNIKCLNRNLPTILILFGFTLIFVSFYGSSFNQSNNEQSQQRISKELSEFAIPSRVHQINQDYLQILNDNQNILFLIEPFLLTGEISSDPNELEEFKWRYNLPQEFTWKQNSLSLGVLAENVEKVCFVFFIFKI